ncbi:hypothetical protein AKO1_014067 [Acrasis kona]|uniref:Uncharacterized protein n=1 Tax=Acrasis kona TaxID=1008807 RepID=A0AAW2Z4H5_9EUKA
MPSRRRQEQQLKEEFGSYVTDLIKNINQVPSDEEVDIDDEEDHPFVMEPGDAGFDAYLLGYSDDDSDEDLEGFQTFLDYVVQDEEDEDEDLEYNSVYKVTSCEIVEPSEEERPSKRRRKSSNNASFVSTEVIVDSNGNKVTRRVEKSADGCKTFTLTESRHLE